MKKIPLRELPDPQLPDEQAATVRTDDIIRNVIKLPQDRQKGADLDEIRRGIRILDALDFALETTERVLDLEDADYNHLREKTLAFSWGMVDKRLLSVIESILDAQETLLLNDQHSAEWAIAAARAVDRIAS